MGISFTKCYETLLIAGRPTDCKDVCNAPFAVVVARDVGCVEQSKYLTCSMCSTVDTFIDLWAYAWTSSYDSEVHGLCRKFATAYSYFPTARCATDR